MRRGEAGFTLIELLVSMAIASVLMLSAFAVLQSSGSSVRHNTERTTAQQTGRVAVEGIVNRLHSGCVAPTVTPIWIAPASKLIGPLRLRFVAAQFEGAPGAGTIPSAEPKPRLYEFEYKASEHILWERQYAKSGGRQPNWTFEESKAAVERRALEHVYQATTEKGATVPVFQYYRYHNAEEGEAERGLIRPTAMTEAELLKEAEEEEKAPGQNEGRGNEVAEVAINLVAEPKHGNPSSSTRTIADLGTTITDATVFRVDPASTTNTTLDAPCT